MNFWQKSSVVAIFDPLFFLQTLGNCLNSETKAGLAEAATARQFLKKNTLPLPLGMLLL